MSELIFPLSARPEYTALPPLGTPLTNEQMHALFDVDELKSVLRESFQRAKHAYYAQQPHLTTPAPERGEMHAQ